MSGSLVGAPGEPVVLCQSVRVTGESGAPQCTDPSIEIRGVNSIPEAEPPQERDKPWFTPDIGVHGTVRDGVLHVLLPGQ